MEMLRLVHSEGILIRIVSLPHPHATNRYVLTERFIYSKSILCVSLSWHRPISSAALLRAHGHRGTAVSPSQTGGCSSFALPARGTPGHSTRGWRGRATRVTSTRHAPGFCAARCSDTAGVVVCSVLWRPYWGGRGDGTEGAQLVGGERERRGSKLKIGELAASRESLALSRTKNWMNFNPRGPYTTSTLEA